MMLLHLSIQVLPRIQNGFLKVKSLHGLILLIPAQGTPFQFTRSLLPSFPTIPSLIDMSLISEFALSTAWVHSRVAFNAFVDYVFISTASQIIIMHVGGSLLLSSYTMWLLRQKGRDLAGTLGICILLQKKLRILDQLRSLSMLGC
jgi:hypothetical protein